MEHNKTYQYKAVIFDMDGTILDTIEDLKTSLNVALEKFGHRHDFTSEETCAFFGSGAMTAVLRALAAEGGTDFEGLLDIDSRTASEDDKRTADEILQFYKPYYAAHCEIETGPYPGIMALLATLRSAGIMTAVVSNKPDPAVLNLCRNYFPDAFDYAAGEKPDVRRKPQPDMVFTALDALGVPAEDAVYVGDSEVDIETAKNAGLDLIMVDWGFRSRRFLEGKGAKSIVSDCEQLEVLLLI